MGRRGPNPVNIGLLRMYASDWAICLYELRDGRPAELYKVKPSELLERDGTRSPVTKHIFVGKFDPETEQARRLLEKMPPKVGNGEWSVVKPVSADRRTWEHFKRARRNVEIEAVLSRIEARIPEPERAPGTEWDTLLRAARQRAGELLDAKANPLLHYPGSKRSSSDDKRIVFFAKVLAGLALGRRPAYVLKRLSHWEPPIPEYSARLAERKGKP